MKISDEVLKNAICNEDYNILSTFIRDNDIDYSFEEDENDSLLAYALSDAGSNSYHFFLENGANVDLLNDEGETVIHSIVFSGDKKRISEVLKIKQININHQSNDGSTALLLAISIKKKEIFNELIRLKANVNIADNEGVTPLHCACITGQKEVVEILIENGVDLWKFTNNGNLAISLAANNGYKDIVKLLYNKMY
jgi:ankyrin repeat protein